MELKSCRVTVRDMEEVAHTVEVTASTLYEAVALGLKQIRGNEWAVGMPRHLPPTLCGKEKRKGCGTRKLTPRRDWTWSVVQKGAPCAHPPGVKTKRSVWKSRHPPTKGRGGWPTRRFALKGKRCCQIV
jgi:hypothetical protein